jgi:serine/threonine protein kinase
MTRSGNHDRLISMAWSLDMHALIGQTLGKYRVEAELVQDTGSFGQIYRATDIRSGTPVALKVLFTDRANNPELRKRFKRECRLAGMLQHPHIVDFYEAGEHNGILYLAMELLPDGSLRSLLQRREHKPWSLRLGLDLIRQAAEGLAYAHDQGIVHRDIKPENLLLRLRQPGDMSGSSNRDPADAYYDLKIGDFGVARFRDQTQITQTGCMPGTPAYKSPDHFRMKELDGRSDIYSLGVIFYEMATGTMPYAVDNADLAMNNILLALPAWPRSLNPDLSPALERIMLRCLEKNPAHRYQSAVDLSTELQEARNIHADQDVPHVLLQPTAEVHRAEHMHGVPARNTLQLEINRQTKFSVTITHPESQNDTFTVTIEGVSPDMHQ